MKTSFFGLHGTFDFFQIGGTDSFFQRFALELSNSGHKIAFVHYGCEQDSMQQPVPGITVHRYVCFDDALEHLSQKAECVLVNAVHRKDRLRFIRFRKANKNEIKFYFVASVFSESWIRRNLYLLEASLYPYNGGVLCMSPRLVKACRIRRNKAKLLLPPVPKQYYVRPEDKPHRNKLVITYMGRTVPGKGVDEAVEVFKQLRGEPNIETQVCGYVWPDNREDHSIHNWLLTQNDIKYVREKYKAWSPEVEKRAAQILRNTDILILPYKRLSSTIDMPLLLLEGMAANCCVITKPLGDIPAVYGDSPFILPQQDFVHRAVELIKQAKNSHNMLEEERKRIATQTAKWDFCTSSVTKKLLKFLT